MKDSIIRVKLMSKTLFSFLILASLLGCSRQVEKWNIVFILADDLAWNQVGYHGTDFYETPNIDKIAEQGMQFSNAYSANPVCSPTRASIMTGKNPARLHITDYIPGSPYPYAPLKNPKILQNGLPLEEITLAEILKEEGYITGHFGKWHLNKNKNYQPGREGDPASQGFDEVFTSVKPEYSADPDADAHSAKIITNHSLQFIEKNKDKPFFCYVSHHVVHRPIMESEVLINIYQTKENSEDPVNIPIMGAMIETMDNGIGQILDKLEELNLTEKTIVIFYSDNGGFEQIQKQNPLRGGKAMVYEGGIKVPLAIKWPDVVQPGSISDELVISDDFFPTISEIIGNTKYSDDVDGLSLLSLLKGTGTIDRNTLYFHYPHYHHLGYKPGGAVRQGNYKLIEWFEDTMTGGENPIDLYDLSTDIGEKNDLSDKMPALRDSLLLKLRNWRKEINAQEMTLNPNYEASKADWRFEARKGYYWDNGVVKTN